MSLARLRVLVSGGLGALLLAVGAGVAEAQTGSITGKVTGGGDAGALEGSRVVVLGTNIATVTNREGVYTLRGVAAGTVQVRVIRLGYDQMTKSVTVSAGQAANLDFVLVSSPFTLDEIVTTATGDQRKAEIGNVVNVIQTAELTKEAPIKNMSELLNSRAPGVTVMQSAGTTGAGTRIRIRGSNSVSLSNEPLLVVDGVRVENGASSSQLGVGGQAPSRINDFNPDDIETIEVVKGPSAAALYGTSAANGVILITTKRGTAGRPRWNTWAEVGALDDKDQYPDNFRALQGTRGGNGQFARCDLNQQDIGQCTAASLARFNPMTTDSTSPLGTGLRQQYGASVSGGSEQAQYFLTAEQEWERGVFDMPATEAARVLAASGRTSLRGTEIHPNQLRKTNLRANLTTQFNPKTSANVNIGYVDSRLFLPENDNNVNGILSSSLTGRGDVIENGVDPWGFFRPGDTFQTENQQRVRRLTTSGQINYSPVTWLSARVLLGMDYTNRIDRQINRFGEGPNFGTNRNGFIQEDPRVIIQYSVDNSATATFNLGANITSKTTGGVQWFRNTFKGTQASGQTLPGGSTNVGNAVVQNAGEVTQETITFGTFLDQNFGYKDRLFVGGAVRADRNSAAGKNLGTKYYPKASVSYLISDESFFPTGKVLSSLRLRGAYGESGIQPGSTDALFFFSGLVAATSGSDVAGLRLAGLGNADLKAETSREFETGFDASFLDSRIALEVTYFNKKSRDALIALPIQASGGNPASFFANLGSVKNEGIEVTLNTQVLQGRNLSWDATFTGSFIRNRLKSINDSTLAVNGINLSGTDQRAVIGTPLGGYWARPIQGFNDVNGNGIIGASEVLIGPKLEFQGSSQPTREISLATGLNLLNSKVRISAQADYRGGSRLYNLNEGFRCQSQFNCRGVNDQTAPEFERLRAQANATAAGALATPVGFFENAEFFKLREVSLTLSAPDSWVRSLRTERISLTLSARNIWTETNYSGLDPELNGQGNGNFAQREFLTQPPPRQFTARLNLGF